MSTYQTTLSNQTYAFQDLRTLLAKATPLRSGDQLAGITAESTEERVAAQLCLADVPLTTFLTEAVIEYELDEVTRLILDEHDHEAFAPVRHMTVGDFRNWLLSDSADSMTLSKLSPGLTPEMVAAVSKIMRVQDLVSVSKKCRVVTSFRSTIGLEGRISTRLQPNHPTDDLKGIAASLLDGLLYGSGDAVIGVNPAKVLGLKPAPEFETWLKKMGIFPDCDPSAATRGDLRRGKLLPVGLQNRLLGLEWIHA